MTDLADKIERLSAAATPGTWLAPRWSSIVGHGIVASPSGRMIGNIVEHDDAPENAELIITLRNAVPEILTALRAHQHAEALAEALELAYESREGWTDKARAALAAFRSVER